MITSTCGLVSLFVLIPLCLLDLVLKAFGMWHSARRNQPGWFICLAIFNTAGILPAIYLLAHKGKKEPQV